MTEIPRQKSPPVSQEMQFISRVSHDLRNPLSTIKFSVGAVLAKEPAGMPPAVHRLLERIDLAADQMTALIADLSELARIQSGTVQAKRRASDLRNPVRVAIDSTLALAERRQQQLVADLPSERIVARVDRGLLERGLGSLLTYTCTTSPNGATITLSLSRRDGEGVFAVAMAEDGQAPTFTSEDGMDEVRRAAGLQLAAIIAEMHGGSFWLERTGEGHAASFFSLPLPS